MKHNVIPVTSHISIHDIELPISVYSDGSVDVKIPLNVNELLANNLQPTITARLKCPAGLLALRYFLDYVEEYHSNVRILLALPYVPNSRQDRLNGNEEQTNAFSLKSVSKLLKSPSVIATLITDPHSEVTPALLEGSRVLTQSAAFKRLKDHHDFECDVVVSPDAGAIKKATEVATSWSRPLVIATKKRDPITNKISGTTVLGGDVKGKHVAIVDDICDGGRTFTALAKELKEQGASKVTLFVTHGIFSYGLDPLREHIDQVFAYYNWLHPDYIEVGYLKTYLNV